MSIFFPEPARRIPHERWFSIAFRTLHLIASSVLLGGHVFGAPAELLFRWLLLTALSGAGLIGLELFRSFRWLYLAQGVLVIAKVALTVLAGLWWKERVVLLLLVVVLGSVGSHMPARLRHFSLLHGRVLDDD
ncbi:MAG TPA: hypothetical protein VMG58_14500 [Candidatus Sulfotelmatobacter sp.]|nr:hypothetical protein [Candidatus Sulfotelmatobacter sp.]